MGREAKVTLGGFVLVRMGDCEREQMLNLVSSDWTVTTINTVLHIIRLFLVIIQLQINK